MRRHLTYANVVSTLCLFVVLGGGAYAAAKIDGKDLKARSVAGSKLKKSAVGTNEVRNGSLLASDFRPGQLKAGPAGDRGPQGLPGVKGETGPQGAPAPDPEDWTNVAEGAVETASGGAPVGCAPERPGAFCRINAPGFSASWSNFGDVYQMVGFHRDRGYVHLRGLARWHYVQTSSAYSVVFYLPPGYRPAKQEVFAASTQYDSIDGRVDVRPDGAVQVQRGVPGGSTSGEQGWVSLSGISFRVG